jgi:hypothetical protein
MFETEVVLMFGCLVAVVVGFGIIVISALKLLRETHRELVSLTKVSMAQRFTSNPQQAVDIQAAIDETEDEKGPTEEPPRTFSVVDGNGSSEEVTVIHDDLGFLRRVEEMDKDIKNHGNDV